MKNFFMTTAIALTTATFFSSANAADFKLESIRVGGLGCPSELTSVVLAPDASAASIIFSQFESRVPALSTGPKSSPLISNISCNIFLNVRIPSGVKLESIDVNYDMRGFATFNKGVQGSFKSYLMSKSGLGTEMQNRGAELITEKLWVNIFDEQEEDFTLLAGQRIPIPSLCSQGNSSDVVSIRLLHSLSSQIMNGNPASEGSITMDTSDITGGLKIRATTSSCSGRTPPPPGPRSGEGRNCRIVESRGRLIRTCL